MEYKREHLEQEIQDLQEAFDGALAVLRKEKLSLEADVKAAQIKRLTYQQELQLLKVRLLCLAMRLAIPVKSTAAAQGSTLVLGCAAAYICQQHLQLHKVKHLGLAVLLSIFVNRNCSYTRFDTCAWLCCCLYLATNPAAAQGGTLGLGCAIDSPFKQELQLLKV